MVKLVGQQREHLRPPRIIIREGSCCGLQRLHALGVHRAELAGGDPSPAVGEHRAAEPVCVAELLGECCGVEQRLAILGVPDLALGLPQADQELAALGAITAGRLVVQLECLAIPAHCLIGGELLKRALGGSPGVVKRLGGVGAHDRGGPMAGELTEPLAGLIATLLLERLCDPLMQSGATGTPEILIQRVLDERMGEREALGSLGALRQQRRRDRLIEQVEQPRLGKLEHREQQIKIEVTADNRGGAERRAGV